MTRRSSLTKVNVTAGETAIHPIFLHYLQNGVTCSLADEAKKRFGPWTGDTQKDVGSLFLAIILTYWAS